MIQVSLELDQVCLPSLSELGDFTYSSYDDMIAIIYLSTNDAFFQAACSKILRNSWSRSRSQLSETIIQREPPFTVDGFRLRALSLLFGSPPVSASLYQRSHHFSRKRMKRSKSDQEVNEAPLPWHWSADADLT